MEFYVVSNGREWRSDRPRLGIVISAGAGTGNGTAAENDRGVDQMMGVQSRALNTSWSGPMRPVSQTV